jgi:LysM repeat protein
VAQSVAEDTLASINDLTVDCTRLTVENGTTFNLCLPQTCETAQVGAADTCWSISAQHNISFAQFMAYNPAINGECTNLRPNGTMVCVTSPDGSYTPVALPGSNSSWSLGEYAEEVVPAPGNTPFGTTSNCGAYYKVQVADTCNRVSLAAKVSVPLFQEINPSIDAGCTNLVPDLWYCVHPTYDWNVTTSGDGTTPSSTTIPPPGPTPTGTTKQCYKWHTIVKDDNCALLQNTLGVTMAQLMAWNPDLKADCTNLILGDAYCVQGPPLPSTSTTTTSSSSTTTKATTTSTSTTTTKPPSTTTTAPACATIYTVKAGDWCAKIWEQFGLSEAQFRALNPQLNAACALDVGQVLCVAAVSACKRTYTVVSGDYCAKIWARFGLTEAGFRGLNPGLNGNCDLDVGQRVCVG